MSINIATLTRHPERLGKDTLYELRSLLARYPYYQPARLLLLKKDRKSTRLNSSHKH